MIEKLTKWLMQWCEKRGKVFRITGTAGPDDVYLIRYYVIKSKYFNFFIHQFLRSDRDDLHDHPWHFMTYLVKGAYTENKWHRKLQQIVHTRRKNLGKMTHEDAADYLSGTGKDRDPWIRKANRFVFRRATDQHQVVVDHDLKPSQKDEAALTLCFTGPTIREWGFIRDYGEIKGVDFVNEVGMPERAPRKWVPWREYLGLPPDTEGRG